MAGLYNAGKHSGDKWIVVLIAVEKKSWLEYAGAIGTNFSGPFED